MAPQPMKTKHLILAAAIRAAIPTSVYYSTINRYCKIVCYDE